MKKIIFGTILSIIFIQNTFATGIISNTPEMSTTGINIKVETGSTNQQNSVEQYLQSKDPASSSLIDKLGLDKKSDNQTSLENSNDVINKKELEKEMLYKTNSELLSKIEELEKQIKEKDQKINSFSGSNEKKEKENQEEIKKITNEKKYLEQQKNEYKIQLDAIKSKINILLADISILEVYKKQYEEKYVAEKKLELTTGWKNLFIFLILTFLIGSFQYGLARERKKYDRKIDSEKLTKLTVISIISYICYVFSLIVFLIIIKPEIAIIFILLSSSLVLSVKPLISSFFSSFLVILNYKIGDKIVVGENIGEIKKINLFSVTMSGYDENNNKSGKEVKIPNHYFIEKEVHKVKKGKFYDNEFSFWLDFSKIKISFKEVIKEIDQIFIKNHIEIRDGYNKKRYNLKIEGKENQKYELKILYREGEKTDIKMEILTIVQKITESEKKDI